MELVEKEAPATQDEPSKATEEHHGQQSALPQS